MPPDTLPPDDSGLPGEAAAAVANFKVETTKLPEDRTTLPLLSAVHTRVLGRDMLELRFHIAVKARIRLLAKRKQVVVASSRTLTLAAGTHSIRLKLDPKRWPTKLQLQTHPLAPLPTVSLRSPSTNTVSTSLVFPSIQAGTSPLGLSW